MENIDMSSVQLITDSYQNYHRSVYLYILCAPVKVAS